MKKNGFTLIELLGVVIVLGIIALIVTPVIYKVLEDSATKTAKVQITNIINSLGITTGNTTRYCGSH